MPQEPKESVIARLLEIRDIQNLARELTPERNKLLRQGVKQGYTQGELEIASGVEQSQISRIVHE
jgi:hypothetical protein